MSRFEKLVVVPSQSRNQSNSDQLHRLFKQIHSADEPSVRELATCRALVIMGETPYRQVPIQNIGVKRALGQRLATMLQGSTGDSKLAEKVIATYKELTVITTSELLSMARR